LVNEWFDVSDYRATFVCKLLDIGIVELVGEFFDNPSQTARRPPRWYEKSC